jgi:hypothetical protein
MNSKFKDEPNDNKVNEQKLYESFNLKTDEEQKWVLQTMKSFSMFYERVRQQPVSSFVRTLEKKCRELGPVFHPFFKIEYHESGVSSSGTYIGSGKLFSFRGKKSYAYYQIGIPKPTKENEITIRNIIAHETAHLYSAIFMLLNKHGNDICTKKSSDSYDIIYNYMNAKEGKPHESYESKASVIGTLILNERADFYRNRLIANARCFCRSFSQIVNDMKNLSWPRRGECSNSV